MGILLPARWPRAAGPRVNGGASRDRYGRLSSSGRPLELIARESISVDAGAAPGFELGEHPGQVVTDGRDDRRVHLVGVVFDGPPGVLAGRVQAAVREPAPS